ncbi:hypothetical protein ACGFMM_11180 [Streptomyces sp. NPDC048604]|uniref:hypothetical protein n=1 Tax=Streptomyces sp. NPDC048604 TaxID=3365578 RepID=UPI00371035B9
MIVIYRPTDGDAEQYDATTLKCSEASLVSRATDKPWPVVRAGLLLGDVDAMRGIAWVLRRREDPDLQFDDFDPGTDELTAAFAPQEVADYCERIAAAESSSDPDEIEAAYRELADSAADPEAAAVYIAESRGRLPEGVTNGG